MTIILIVHTFNLRVFFFLALVDSWIFNIGSPSYKDVKKIEKKYRKKTEHLVAHIALEIYLHGLVAYAFPQTFSHIWIVNKFFYYYFQRFFYFIYYSVILSCLPNIFFSFFLLISQWYCIIQRTNLWQNILHSK